jgi:hypothetical protein
MVTLEGCSGTQQPRIVQRLYYGHTRLPAGIVGGRRNQREGIVEVYKIGFVPMEEAGDFSPSLSRPHRPAY